MEQRSTYVLRRLINRELLIIKKQTFKISLKQISRDCKILRVLRMANRTVKGMTLFGDLNRSSLNSVSTSGSSVWAVKLNRLHKLLSNQKTDLLTDLSMEELHLSWLENLSARLGRHSSSKSMRKLRGQSQEGNTDELRQTKYSPPASPISQASRHERGSTKRLRQNGQEARRGPMSISSQQEGGVADVADGRGLDLSGTASGGGNADLSWLATSGVDGRLRQFDDRVWEVSPTGRKELITRTQAGIALPNAKRRATTDFLHSSYAQLASPIPKQPQTASSRPMTKIVKFKQSTFDRLGRSADNDEIAEIPISGRSGSSAALHEPPLTDRLQSKALSKSSRVAQSHLLISTFDGIAAKPLGSWKDKPLPRNLPAGHQIIHASKETLSSATSAKLTPRRGLTGVNFQTQLNHSQDVISHHDARFNGANSMSKKVSGPKLNHQQMLTGVGLQTISSRQKASALSLIPNVQEDKISRIREREGTNVTSKISESLRQLIGQAQTPIRSTPSISDASLPKITTTDMPQHQKLVSFTTKTFSKHLKTEPKSSLTGHAGGVAAETSAKTADHHTHQNKPKPSNIARLSGAGISSAHADMDRMFRLYLK